MMSTTYSVMFGSLLAAPILISIAIVLFIRKRVRAAVILILLSAAAFFVAILPIAVYLVRVGPSTPGDANPVNIVDGFVLAQYGGVWTLESTNNRSSFETFDLMGLNDTFILLVEGDATAPTSVRLISRRSGTARPPTVDLGLDRVSVERWLAAEGGPPLADLRSPEAVQWSWALFGRP